MPHKIKLLLLLFSLQSWAIMSQTTTISGKITGATTNVIVQLTGDNLNLETAVDEAGNYSFENIPVGSLITITPAFSTPPVNPLNGVSTLDVVLGNRHVLGQDFLDDATEIIALDINESGSVTTYDLVIIRRLILAIPGIIESTPTLSKAWVFIEDTQLAALNITTGNIIYDFTNSFTISNTDPNIFNFTAIKYGDVNKSAIP